MSRKNIITISRQYGSGGRLIGRKLAEELNIPFYDNELITLAAKQSGYSEEVFKSVDEKATNSLLYSLAVYGNLTGSIAPMPLNDQLFIIQSNIIRELAQQGSCVIVGRCADYVLDEEPDCINVFVYADMPHRAARAVAEYGLDAAKAENIIQKTDKKRSTYYTYYSNKRWGQAENYHLCVDSGPIGIEGAMGVISAYVRART